jgi:drug/metabolite transporter (DMT)-like permease
MKSIKGYLLILGGTAFWGISATIAKFLFQQHVDTLVLVQMRLTISCVFLVGFLLLARPELLRVRLRDLHRFALMGVIGAAGSNFTYYFTIQQTNVATAILMQYMAPLLVLAYSAVTREEKVSLPKVAAGIISLTGCFLAVAGKDFSVLSLGHLGLLTGVLSAFCWAFANIWLRRLLRHYSVWTCLAYAFVFGSIFWMFFNPPWRILLAGYSPATWWTFLGFAVISILIPHSLYFSGVRYLTASRAIITATFEPVVAIVSAFIFLNEQMAPLQIGGALMVIAAIAVLQLRPEPDGILPPA